MSDNATTWDSKVAAVENIGTAEVAADATMEAVPSKMVATAVAVDNPGANAADEFTVALATEKASDDY